MPAPPYSGGKMMPSSPSLPSSLIVARGNSLASSHFITFGATSRSANSRTVFLRCSCSSFNWKSTCLLATFNGARRSRVSLLSDLSTVKLDHEISYRPVGLGALTEGKNRRELMTALLSALLLMTHQDGAKRYIAEVVRLSR